MTNFQRRWGRRPDPSTWGDFGDDDGIGRINLLGPDKVLEGIREVREGRTFSLGLPLNLPGGRVLNNKRRPPITRPTIRDHSPNVNCALERWTPEATDVVNDDVLVLHTQYSTHWDALAHVGALFDADGDGEREIVYYNGFRGGVEVLGPESVEDCGIPGAEGESTSDLGAVGIGSMADHPVQGRAVLVDLARHMGTGHQLVRFSDIEEIIDADGIEVRQGDIVLFHTGYTQMLVDCAGDPDPDLVHAYGAALDGRDPALLEWITDSGIAAIAADNYAVERHPSAAGGPGPHALLPLHEHCLFKLGIPLGELWYLSDLAAHLAGEQRSAFLLSAPPLHLPGASGSPLNPIATV